MVKGLLIDEKPIVDQLEECEDAIYKIRKVLVQDCGPLLKLFRIRNIIGKLDA